MPDLVLNIPQEGEISLPAILLDGPLSLTEIGAVVFLVALEAGHVDFSHFRVQTPELAAVFKTLKERGIFEVSVSPGKVSLKLDLDKAMPVGGR